jgi:hypothetical protein
MSVHQYQGQRQRQGRQAQALQAQIMICIIVRRPLLMSSLYQNYHNPNYKHKHNHGGRT